MSAGMNCVSAEPSQRPSQPSALNPDRYPPRSVRVDATLDRRVIRWPGCYDTGWTPCATATKHDEAGEGIRDGAM